MWRKFKPAVNRKWLIIISGLMWSSVGIFLNILVSRWFKSFELLPLVAVILSGLVLGFVITRFGFGKIAQKNIDRIYAYPEQICIFAFQEWRSYILIALMMIMGIFMRTTGLIPKDILAPMYIGIGTALFLASFKYYKLV